jgi:hypothetical protein
VTVRHVGDGPELLVNGEPIATAELAAGDQLAFGPFELTVHMPSSPQTITPPNPMLSTGDWPWLTDLAEV